jgi:bifunctional non-homologous end joining protein LigD
MMAKRGRGAAPEWIPPQLATLAADAPDSDDWLHEIKYDGYRLLAWVDGPEVRLLTRNRNDWTVRYPSVASALGGLGLRNSVLDGELGVELEDGRTSFQALQNLAEGSPGTMRFWIFDALFLDGADLRPLGQLERKTRLAKVLRGAGGNGGTSGDAGRGVIRYSDHVLGHGADFFAQACSHGLEGIISKRASASYRGGRGKDWLKVKCVREQEFVVGGYTDPGGARKGLGALHVGAYDDAGVLHYRGKVGTGFSHATLRQLYRQLRPLKQRESPFTGGPRGAAARASHWVEPRLVAQIRYTELTSDGRLRHPVYHGLREDKEATDVRDEAPVAASAADPTRAAKSSPAKTVPAKSRPAKPPPAQSRPAESQPAESRPAESQPAKSRSAKSRPGAPIQVAGTRLTSPDKVLYRDQGVTKSELAHYYEAVSEWMLPHISGRPLTLVRCPAGQDAQCFFQKHFDTRSVPGPLSLVEIEERDGPALYGTLDSTAGIVSLVQLGALELHTWNSRADRLERPDRFVIDLDPGPGVTWDAIVDASLHVHDLLADIGLESFVKTTGGKGLHVVVPLTRRADWDEVKAFSGAVASLLARSAPELYTTEMAKAKRKGRILLDYLRNSRGATAIEAYSTRARPGAPVAAPIHWDELGDGVRADSFNVRNMAARMRELGADPWLDIGAVRQSITAEMRRRVGV